ncbi:MAG: nucleoside diphosphate kinase [uncultured bacterium]|nr:MAG: nucleoside diphosphate kinase [uncultured bacterium]
MSLEHFICRNCGFDSKVADAHRDFLDNHGCSQPPLYCNACFVERLSQIWEVPGERRIAICSKCGMETRLHFVPIQDRPVFCPQCYNRRKDT